MPTIESQSRRTAILVLLASASLVWGCEPPNLFGGDDETGQPQLSESEREKLDGEVDEAEAGAHGFVLYRASYQNLNVAGRADGKRFAFIAGTHDPSFPFFGDRPWDNGLVLLGERQFHFNHRRQGPELDIAIPMGKEQGKGTLEYEGKMVRTSDQKTVEVDLEIPVSFRRYPPMQLGWPLDFLDGEVAEKTAGMRWQPFELESNRGRISIAGGPSIRLSGVNGELEYGTLSNVQAPEFAFTYDYVNVAEPGSDGYAYVDFAANPIDDGKIGDVLGWYMDRTASATVTLDDQLIRGNPHRVERPPQDDDTVVLFENTVDLGLATLKRQMIETKTRGAGGDKLYGLREIFIPKR